VRVGAGIAPVFVYMRTDTCYSSATITVDYLNNGTKYKSAIEPNAQPGRWYLFFGNEGLGDRMHVLVVGEKVVGSGILRTTLQDTSFLDTFSFQAGGTLADRKIIAECP
jgi:hypothetical protein